MNPLRGRSAELGRLLDALRAAEHGEASLTVVTGELVGAKVMWLLATRPEPGGVTDKLTDAVQDQVPVHTLRLAPLSNEDVLELAADRLDGPLDPALSVRLSGVQGVPFIAE